jgi:uncharacterized protein
MATLRLRRRPRTKRAHRANPSPFAPPWTPGPAVYGVGVRHNVAVPMSDGVMLRADIHYPTVPETGLPAAGRPDRWWRHALPDQAGLHRGYG